MIDFRKAWLGYNTLFSLTGSSIPRVLSEPVTNIRCRGGPRRHSDPQCAPVQAFLPALLAGTVCAILERCEPCDQFITESIVGSQPFQIYFWIVSFSTVFR